MKQSWKYSLPPFWNTWCEPSRLVNQETRKSWTSGRTQETLPKKQSPCRRQLIDNHWSGPESEQKKFNIKYRSARNLWPTRNVSSTQENVGLSFPNLDRWANTNRLPMENLVTFKSNKRLRRLHPGCQSPRAPTRNHNPCWPSLATRVTQWWQESWRTHPDSISYLRTLKHWVPTKKTSCVVLNGSTSIGCGFHPRHL